MELRLGCKRWSSGRQKGFRVYAAGIRDLAPVLAVPSSDGRWHSLGDFCAELAKGSQPPAYTRAVLISDGSQSQNATFTIATLPPMSIQGYVTAAQGTWLHEFVTRRVNEDLTVEYSLGATSDMVLLPQTATSVEAELAAAIQSADTTVLKYSRRHGFRPPPDAKERGLFFEILEYQDRVAHVGSGWQVNHRYPAVDSAEPFLRTNNGSCDIDIVSPAGNFSCVEVKSSTGAPGSPFVMSRREWDSRIWCAANGLPYEISLYYHVSFRVIERRIIAGDEPIRAEPSGHLCFPP